MKVDHSFLIRKLFTLIRASERVHVPKVFSINTLCWYFYDIFYEFIGYTRVHSVKCPFYYLWRGILNDPKATNQTPGSRKTIHIRATCSLKTFRIFTFQTAIQFNFCWFFRYCVGMIGHVCRFT